MNVLIADDQPINLKLLRAQLEAEGMTVYEATDGVQALALLEHKPVDVVISDVLMPTMDGYQLCHAMRKNERYRAIPCILYSNTFASHSSQQLALGFGADLFLKKPAPVATILAAFNEALRQGGRRPGAVANPVQHLKETLPYSAFLIGELQRQNQELEETKNQMLEINHKFLIRTKQLEELEIQLRKTNSALEHRVRARTAELETANRELESFSYSVSHDLCAPLRSISGFSQRVLDRPGQLNAASRNDLQRVVAAAGQMTELIDALLALSKATRAELRRQPLNLSALAQSVLAELAQANPGGATEVAVQPDLTVEADGRLLRVVLTNLLSNAWKFTRKAARPRIEFGAGESGGQSAFFVRDNGAGFDMAQAGRLFGAFQRLHSLAEFEGTGIGLATVHRIVHRHGGRIWAESVPQQGATFYFTLGGSVPVPAPAIP
jgi:signal transduction histidine kinase